MQKELEALQMRVAGLGSQGNVPVSSGASSPSIQGVIIDETSDGRRTLEVGVGATQVEVVEIPSDQLKNGEWEIIQEARHSYFQMWGSGKGLSEVEEDIFDARSDITAHVPYKVWHYIATIKFSGEEDKIMTLRKIYYPLQRYQKTDKMNAEEILNWIEQYLPDEVSFWQMTDIMTNRVNPLWDELKAKMRSNGLFDFSVINRCGTIPYTVIERDERIKEKSALAFAALQLLAASGNTDEIILAQQCEEFPKKVSRIVGRDGEEVILNFSHAVQTFGLTTQQTLRLNREHPAVIKHLTAFPGYWTDNTLAASTVTRLIKEGKVSKDQIQTAWERLRHHALEKQEVMRKLLKDIPPELNILSERDLPIDVDNLEEPIIALLTKPRYFKYMVPLAENSALYHGLAYESGDGPYLAALIPAAWEKSAKNLLGKAQEKYAIESL